MQRYPKVGIIILNWNKKDYVLNLLDSLKNLAYENYDTIVIDNASTDGSPEIIRNNFPGIKIIENSTNLGGTGGFNTGLEYILKHTQHYEYVWLLDNDAEIGTNTLIELIRVMEKDKSVGIAGSKIIDSNNRDITIELGSFIKKDTIGIVPFSRNKKNIRHKIPVDSDYVAICSALVRVEALIKVGLMDERLFIFWDDIDWGLSFSDCNYRVVAVPKSFVYHPSFTERRRGEVSDYYYGVRNPLLVYSKNTRRSKRLLLFYRHLRNLSKIYILGLFTNRSSNSLLIFRAIMDFCRNKWGEYNHDHSHENNNDPGTELANIFKYNPPKILIIAGDEKSVVIKLEKKLKDQYPSAEVSLLVEHDRKDIFQDRFQNILFIDKGKLGSLVYILKKYCEIFSDKFDISVNIHKSSNPYLQPFSFSGRISIEYCPVNDKFKRTRNNYYNSYKLFLTFVFSEILALFSVPIVFLCSLKYERK